MTDFDMQRIVYEMRFNAKLELAKTVVADLEKLGIPFADFLDGLAIFMDESLQLSKPAALLQQAHQTLLNESR